MHIHDNTNAQIICLCNLLLLDSLGMNVSVESLEYMASIDWAVRRFTATFREVSKPLDRML